ncbi:MAG: Eco57I restriction-modification methylase domain-containing protein, partial [bacterium]
MEVQDILEKKEDLLAFLKEKGLQEEKDYTDEDYNEGTYFKIDKRKLLVVYEIFDEEKLKEIKDHFLIDRGLSYCIVIFNHKLIFFRNFGETKHFLYSERTKNKISKTDRLDKIKEEGFDFIFQAGKDISGKFYDSFKIKRNLLVKHIKNDVEPIQKYLIAQKIFDRFFFIYFLCHKGIIKFKDGGKVSGENLFSRILLKEKDFLGNLKKLFHLFNNQENNIFKIGDYEINIPYLNGGLFRPDVLEQDLDIGLKNNQWEQIFDFLNSYHWIIEDIKDIKDLEEDVNKKEGYLTPEILGHVYERSVVEWEQKGFEKEAEEAAGKISERKKKGVYYTPESITDYISNKTIKPFVLDKLDNKYDDVDDLIKSKNKSDIKKAISILNEIKVLDPACGSGAFLIKASELLFNLKRRLFYVLGENNNYYNQKLEIITENIYGVDILSGAIEISKLRLWLWLISDFEEDENKIQALPNIEYNLKVGNSLIGWLDEKLVQIPLNTPLTEKVDGIFTGLIAFSENGDGEELKKARELLKSYNLDNYIEAYYILFKIYRRTHGLKAENLRSILETIRKSIYSSVTPAFRDFVNTQIKPKYDSKKPPITQEQFSKLQIFHWKIDFGHIIKEGGFDIVVGNPPYGNILDKTPKKITTSFYDSYSGEIASLFIERSINALSLSGYLSFIITYAITFNKSLSENRLQLVDNFEESYISSFDRDRCRIFSDMTQSVSVMICNKKNKEGEGKIFTSKFYRLFDVDDENALNSIEYKEVSKYLLNKEVGAGYDEKHRLPKIGDKKAKDILDKLLSQKNTFGELVDNNPKNDFVWIRTSGNYWYNAFDKKPYTSTKFKKYKINKQLREYT